MMVKNKLMREKMPYRDCVGLVIFNDQGKVWIGHRLMEINDENECEKKLWQLPQGGIDKGELPLDAAKRELYEETGIRSVNLLAEMPDWLYYDVPDCVLGTALKGKYRGQRQKWFAFHFTGSEDEITITPSASDQKAEFDEWAWVDLESISAMVVSFKREVYEAVIRQFQPLGVPR